MVDVETNHSKCFLVAGLIFLPLEHMSRLTKIKLHVLLPLLTNPLALHTIGSSLESEIVYYDKRAK